MDGLIDVWMDGWVWAEEEDEKGRSVQIEAGQDEDMKDREEGVLAVKAMGIFISKFYFPRF